MRPVKVMRALELSTHEDTVVEGVTLRGRPTAGRLPAAPRRFRGGRVAQPAALRRGDHGGNGGGVSGEVMKEIAERCRVKVPPEAFPMMFQFAGAFGGVAEKSILMRRAAARRPVSRAGAEGCCFGPWHWLSNRCSWPASPAWRSLRMRSGLLLWGNRGPRCGTMCRLKGCEPAASTRQDDLGHR